LPKFTEGSRQSIRLVCSFLSVRKFSRIVLGNVDTSNTVYNIGKQPIYHVSEVRDLGIFVDSSLKFTSHINSIVAKANGRAALIRKCFVSRNLDVMIRAFKVYLRRMLEYAVYLCGRLVITTQ